LSILGSFPSSLPQIFAEGKQIHIPVLAGSNGDEATVFGHNDLKAVDDYKSQLLQAPGGYSEGFPSLSGEL